MSENASIKLNDRNLEFPVIVGSEGEKAIDLRTLRSDSGGCITFDEGYGNTGSCVSNVTFIDGDAGILRYRGYPIEQLAQHSSFVETAYLVIHGELPTVEQYAAFSARLREQAGIHERMLHLFEGYPRDAHPMAILSAMVNSLACYDPHLATNDHNRDLENFEEASAIALSKVRTIAAVAYRMSRGLPVNYSNKDLKYCENFLHMMFSDPFSPYTASPEVARAMNLILLLHADHEQNCSTSTVRMVASSGANLFASTSAGISALWGPLHGGANVAVIGMLRSIHEQGDDGSRFIEAAKSGKARLMGFGHRVYKNFDPRAKIIAQGCEELLDSLGLTDPLLDIARRLAEAALDDPYFLERKLYPNVDFYSGIMMRAIGIPLNMFTVMFAIGRMPGWIANWHEVAADQNSRIYRPRQIYQGPVKREYVSIKERT
ncbi:MAG: citrate (Si)-synthase [Verrucomicrobia bacterium]|nr:MAG: citrate (Si)-synthase [Verrucomicrobiota bacterium]